MIMSISRVMCVIVNIVIIFLREQYENNNIRTIKYKCYYCYNYGKNISFYYTLL